jgi:type II secretion system protein L
LQGAAEQGATGGRGLILYTGAAEWHQQSAKIEALRERFDGIKIQLLSAGPLALFGQQLPTAAPINLLQGSYAPAKASTVGWQAWKVAAILLACLLGLHLAGKTAELSALKRSEKSLDTSIGDTYRMAMPGQPKPLDPRRQMEMRLAAAQNGGGQEGLLPALQALVDSRTVAPGTSVKALSFRQGIVDMKLSGKDATTLDRLSQSLNSHGWKAVLTSGNTTPDGYEGRMQMSGK